jgi:hypothetical protein
MSSSKQQMVDALERRLLEAARLERPDESASHRAFLALAGGALIGSATATTTATSAAATSAAATIGGAGSAGAPSAAAGTAGATAIGGAKVVAGATTLVGIAKAVAIGAISGAVALGAAQKMQEPRVAAPPAAHVERTAKGAVERTESAPVAAKQAEPGAAAEQVELLSNESPLIQPETAPAHATRDAVPKAQARPAPIPVQPTDVPPVVSEGTPKLASLAEEVALLDRARNALVTGDPSHALAILDGYERAKVGTTLSAEAALLRIEALVQRGETVRAASLASEFLRAHPKSPVADRVRAIIQSVER